MKFNFQFQLTFLGSCDSLLLNWGVTKVISIAIEPISLDKINTNYADFKLFSDPTNLVTTDNAPLFHHVTAYAM